MKLIWAFAFLMIFAFTNASNAYVHTKSVNGDTLHWSNPSQNIKINPNSSGALSSSVVYNLVAESISEWMSNAGVVMSYSETNDPPNSNQNDIYFSTNSLFFTDSSVVAVTQVSFRESDGLIIEADIIVNDNDFNYNNDDEDRNYLKNAMTHEIGHFFGLGHSQVKDSTMFYRLGIGQYKLSKDDIGGFHSIYNKSASKKISGHVIGGANIGVFGAHVQAISLSDGRIIAGALSDQNGYFEIYGLHDDNYYLYISPPPYLQSMTTYYGTVRKDFCDARSDYKGSFYYSCLNSERGFPKGTTVNSDVYIGSVSIRCGLKVPKDYLSNRKEVVLLDDDSTTEIDISDANGKVEKAVVGYFTQSDLDNNRGDRFKIDLSGLSISGTKYLHVKFLTHQFYSPLKLSVKAERENLASATYPTLNADNNIINIEDNRPDFDFDFSIPLSGIASDNVVTLTVTPEDLVKHVQDNVLLHTTEDFFPSESEYVDDRFFYLMVFNLSEISGLSNTPYNEKTHSNSSDNHLCTEGVYTYGVTPSTGSRAVASAGTSASSESKDSDSGAVACGSIGDAGGPGAGPLNLLIGLCLSMLVAGFRKKSLHI